jgi:hypothetical protein
MRLGAANGLTSLVMALYALQMDDPGAQALVRLGAGFQFMHIMATFACATFMQIGAVREPALFPRRRDLDRRRLGAGPGRGADGGRLGRVVRFGQRDWPVASACTSRIVAV